MTATVCGAGEAFAVGGCIPTFALVAGADFAAGVGVIVPESFFRLSGFGTAGGGAASLVAGARDGRFAVSLATVRARLFADGSGGATVRTSADCFPLHAS